MQNIRQTTRIKVTSKQILGCLLALNVIATAITLSIHRRLAPPPNDDKTHDNINSIAHRGSMGHHKNTNLKYEQKSIIHRNHYNSRESSNKTRTKVPFLTSDHFYEKYRNFNISLPVSDKNTRRAFESCGPYPDFLDFFHLPKSQRSRFFEDKIIYDTFFKPNAAQVTKQLQAAQYGTYVELGAFNGREESNTIFFDECLAWDGLLIEANSESYKKVIENRPNAVKMSFSPTCLDEKDHNGKQQTASFYDYPLSNNGMKDLAQSYVGKNTIEIPCGSLTPVLLDVFGPNQTISFMSLDVEGAETLVLNTMDFSKLDIHIMMIEVQNSYCPHPMSCPQTHLIRQRMAEANYALFADLVEASDVYAKHGTDAWRRGKSVQEGNAKRQWILKRKMLLKEKRATT